VRTLAQIKTKFDNLKTKARKTVAANKQSVTRTGGGPSEYTDIDPVTDAVLQIINMKTVTGFNNPWDCDGDLEENISSNVSHKFILR
jgi:hypothetical protein